MRRIDILKLFLTKEFGLSESVAAALISRVHSSWGPGNFTDEAPLSPDAREEFLRLLDAHKNEIRYWLEKNELLGSSKKADPPAKFPPYSLHVTAGSSF